jgi:UDP-2,4-diacetamido-2,4,6-trideoxy-beta-L-altropyranose hydrolase
MRIAFRADASTRMGTGHVMRCLTLAAAARARGAETRFVCREHPGHLRSLLCDRGMLVKMLPAPAHTPDSVRDDYAAWLGVPPEEDARQTIEALDGEKPEWLIVDHYGLGLEWEGRLRPHVGRIIAIDDLANRRHDADLLLDQNYTLEGERRYAGLVPPTCTLLVGPRHGLLGPQFAARRRASRKRVGRVQRVLVFFGGSDPFNTTALALTALSASPFSHWEVDIVLGANHPDRNGIEQQASRRLLTTVWGPQEHLADLMMQADLAIGAGGTTTWERMCMGLPSVVVSIADNQRPASQALDRANLIRYAGHVTHVTIDDLRRSLRSLTDDADQLAALSIQNQIEVDGMGVARLIERLFPTPTGNLYLRRASRHDVFSYFNWANDPEVRTNAIHTEPISWSTHEKWFTTKLADPDAVLFVLEADGLPVGQVRFDKQGDEARIDYSLDAVVRGRGWAVPLVSMGAFLMQQMHPVRLRADVKESNGASRAVFVRLGFDQVATPQGLIFYRRSPVPTQTVK